PRFFACHVRMRRISFNPAFRRDSSVGRRASLCVVLLPVLASVLGSGLSTANAQPAEPPPPPPPAENKEPPKENKEPPPGNKEPPKEAKEPPKETKEPPKKEKPHEEPDAHDPHEAHNLNVDDIAGASLEELLDTPVEIWSATKMEGKAEEVAAIVTVYTR